MMKLCLRSIIEKVLNRASAAFFYTPQGYSYLAENFESTVILSPTNNCEIFFETIEKKIKTGFTAVLLLNYEASYLLNSSYFGEIFTNSLKEEGKALFLKTADFLKIDSESFDFSLIREAVQNPGYNLEDLQISSTETDYRKNLEKIRDYIAKGETYQVNFTTEASFLLSGEIADFVSVMIYSQSARYTSIIKDDNRLILSFSPELFFQVSNGKISSRPMKGTAGRGLSIADDENIINVLRESEKERAENIMIVDLLRNDIGRISRIGSVEVSDLFSIEKYETLFQMVSTVTGTLYDEVTWLEIFRSLFPCGSVTGAPKFRTMEIIKELEKRNRGIYCGAIGFINADYATFSVPIRTIECSLISREARIGVGSGIVWDSITEAEKTEYLTKLTFLKNPLPWFEIFETIGVRNGEIIFHDEHISRLLKTADYFLFSVKQDDIKEALYAQKQKIPDTGNYAIRIKADKWGDVSTSWYVITDTVESPKVLVSEKRIDSNDRFRRFKTTLRELYDTELKKARLQGYFDVLFFNEKDELAEGAITNIVLLINGKYYTPPLNAGILDGIARSAFLNENMVIETPLTIHDLRSAEQVLLMNSVRGIIKINPDAVEYPPNRKN